MPPLCVVSDLSRKLLYIYNWSNFTNVVTISSVSGIAKLWEKIHFSHFRYARSRTSNDKIQRSSATAKACAERCGVCVILLPT